MSRRHPGRGRLTVAALLTALLTLPAALLAQGPAHAADYRYWSFWQQGKSGAWVYATQGPSIARPDDGDVEGFRFAVSANSGSAEKPRGAADFDAICADTPAKDGQKRVALVVDFGTPDDAPGGEQPPKRRTACARVDSDGTTADALAAVAKPLRYNSSALLCAISGYPEQGCGEQVSGKESGGKGDKADGTASAKDGDGDGGPSVGLLAGVAAIVALGAAAVWQARRRRG
ncbi:SCO2322 family protein [Streptomyces alboflavus]|uniref:SCO2322 family protein n=1 Tax=Streptomyces alboflavus TaxID=67267 RepID=UPI00068B51B6|nr:SCO2322 family protein [Streptomyces alboflavus]